MPACADPSLGWGRWLGLPGAPVLVAAGAEVEAEDALGWTAQQLQLAAVARGEPEDAHGPAHPSELQHAAAEAAVLVGRDAGEPGAVALGGGEGIP